MWCPNSCTTTCGGFLLSEGLSFVTSTSTLQKKQKKDRYVQEYDFYSSIEHIRSGRHFAGQNCKNAVKIRRRGGISSASSMGRARPEHLCVCGSWGPPFPASASRFMASWRVRPQWRLSLPLSLRRCSTSPHPSSSSTAVATMSACTRHARWPELHLTVYATQPLACVTVEIQQRMAPDLSLRQAEAPLSNAHSGSRGRGLSGRHGRLLLLLAIPLGLALLASFKDDLGASS